MCSEDALPSNGVRWMAGETSGRESVSGCSWSNFGFGRGVVVGIEACI
jgi:hypothetical protein